jgi:hypothetical protein
LLSFSRRKRLEPKAVDLNEIVAAMRDLLQSTMGGSIRIDIKLGKALSLALADPTQIELAFSTSRSTRAMPCTSAARSRCKRPMSS